MSEATLPRSWRSRRAVQRRSQLLTYAVLIGRSGRVDFGE